MRAVPFRERDQRCCILFLSNLYFRSFPHKSSKAFPRNYLGLAPGGPHSQQLLSVYGLNIFIIWWVERGFELRTVSLRCNRKSTSESGWNDERDDVHYFQRGFPNYQRPWVTLLLYCTTNHPPWMVAGRLMWCHFIGPYVACCNENSKNPFMNCYLGRISIEFRCR